MILYIMKFICLTVIITALVIREEVEGHGRLMNPPSRSSAWRKHFKTPKNYDDDSLYCGGLGTHQKNGMKCGICGDPVTDRVPRANENGGRYGKGVIVGKYDKGAVVPVTVELTTNHWGKFFFEVCSLSSPTEREQESCFQPLNLADGNAFYKLKTKKNGIYKVDVKLPDNLQCQNCVLRWKYMAGNNWGCDKVDGREKCCVGCGPIQEHFYGCADISIN